MIKVNNLSKVFRTEEIETTALNGVSFEIADGEFVAIMGPSGWRRQWLVRQRVRRTDRGGVWCVHLADGPLDSRQGGLRAAPEPAFMRFSASARAKPCFAAGLEG